MTVAQYITALQSLPPELEVIIAAGILDKQTLFRPAVYPHLMRVAVRHLASSTVLESQLQGNPLQQGCPEFDAVRLA